MTDYVGLETDYTVFDAVRAIVDRVHENNKEIAKKLGVQPYPSRQRSGIGIGF